MPSGTVTLDWGLLSFVGLEAATEFRDGLAIRSGLLAATEKAHGKGNPKWTTGGRDAASIQMFTHTGVTQFSTGYEEFDSSAIEPERDAYQSPAISGLLLKIGINEIYTYGSTTQGLKPKVKSLVTNGMSLLHRAWTQRIVAGIGSGFSNWVSFNGFDSVTGIFERGAPGSGQSNSIGGLSKSTYASAIGWNNRVVNLNNAFGANENGLFQLVTQTKRHKDGGNKVWLFSDQGMNNEQRFVQANTRYYMKDQADAGVPVEIYHGYPIYGEPQMPVSTATGGSTTNTYPITAYFIDFDDIFFKWMKGVKMDDGVEIPDGYFGAGPWRQIQGLQSVYGMPMFVAGQTIVTDMGSSGVAYGGESY